jgi:hypothetical protein
LLGRPLCCDMCEGWEGMSVKKSTLPLWWTFGCQHESTNGQITGQNNRQENKNIKAGVAKTKTDQSSEEKGKQGHTSVRNEWRAKAPSCECTRGCPARESSVRMRMLMEHKTKVAKQRQKTGKEEDWSTNSKALKMAKRWGAWRA